MTLVKPFSAQISSHFDVFPFYGMNKAWNEGMNFWILRTLKAFLWSLKQTVRIIV